MTAIRVGQPKSHRFGAFSLLELLVVVAVIGVIVAITIPALARAKERAMRTYCLSNLHQIGNAFGQYNTDYDGILPIGPLQQLGQSNDLQTWWAGVNHATPDLADLECDHANPPPYPYFERPLNAYVGGATSKILLCPVDPALDGYANFYNGYYGTSYNFNGYIRNVPEERFNAITPGWIMAGAGQSGQYDTFLEIQHPAETIMVCEPPAFAVTQWAAMDGNFLPTGGPGYIVIFNGITHPWSFHDRNAVPVRDPLSLQPNLTNPTNNTLFFDGHADIIPFTPGLPNNSPNYEFWEP